MKASIFVKHCYDVILMNFRMPNRSRLTLGLGKGFGLWELFSGVRVREMSDLIDLIQ
jgi:hypothetical protein